MSVTIDNRFIEFLENAKIVARRYNSSVITMEHAFLALLENSEEVVVTLEKIQYIDIDNFIRSLKGVCESKKYNTDLNLEPVKSVAVSAVCKKVVEICGSQVNVSDLHLITTALYLYVKFRDDDANAENVICSSTNDPNALVASLECLTLGRAIENKESAIVDKNNMGYSLQPNETQYSVVEQDNAMFTLKNCLCSSNGEIILLQGDSKSGKTTALNSLAVWASENQYGKVFILDQHHCIMGNGDATAILKDIIKAAYAESGNVAIMIDDIDLLIEKFPTMRFFITSAVKTGLSFICSSSLNFNHKSICFSASESLVKKVILEPLSKSAIAKILKDELYLLAATNDRCADERIIDDIAEHAVNIEHRNPQGYALDILDKAFSVAKVTKHKGIVSTKQVNDAIRCIKQTYKQDGNGEIISVLESLETNLKKNLFGQDHAISEVVTFIKSATLGFKIDENRPRGVFALAGPTGVGKTETALTVANELGLEPLIINMGEYHCSSSVNRLIGAAPGFVGHDKGDGILSEHIQKHPKSLIILDEIEKADPKVFDVFLSAFDKGVVDTATGKKIAFKDCLFFITSNAGVSTSSSNIGLLRDNSNEDYEFSLEDFKSTFRKEFIGRLSTIIEFKPLSNDALYQIAKKSVNKLTEIAKRDYGWQIEGNNSCLHKMLIDKYSDRLNGARTIERGVEKELGSKLSELIIKQTPAGVDIEISVRDGNIELTAK